MQDSSTGRMPDGVQLVLPPTLEYQDVLTYEALSFIARLQRKFGERRLALLAARAERQKRLDQGEKPDFLASTAAIRQDKSWQVAPTPPLLQKRRVEITGPTDRKMLINALNSGASIFMADFEDANSPTFSNMVDGQRNLSLAIDGSLTFNSPEGKFYSLNQQVATLLVRPRGWHLDEKHLLVDGQPVSGSLFDFGLYFFRNARRLLDKGAGPYFYLPKLESHLEARLWNDVFNEAQDALGIPRGVIRATVLIETILAAFEMEEILYELRTHSAGLNAGRWDYIFSIIKKFRNRPDVLLPDRAMITMTTPFMRAYTELLVKTCHSRGAHAMGGMAAFIPSRKDPEVNETALAKVREDKLREVKDGFDGTWVAHPDLVPVAMAIFDQALGEQPHQKERLRPEVQMCAGDLLNFSITGGKITEKGLRTNINVAIQYLEAWLRGSGAVGIYNLMEDTATAEISRAQIWQWVNHPSAALEDGQKITAAMVHAMIPEELEKIKSLVGAAAYAGGKYQTAAELFECFATCEEFEEFLTLPAYQKLD